MTAAAAVGGRLKLYGSVANQWEIHPQHRPAPSARGRSAAESSSLHNGSREASPWAFSSMGKQEQGQEVLLSHSLTVATFSFGLFLITPTCALTTASVNRDDLSIIQVALLLHSSCFSFPFFLVSFPAITSSCSRKRATSDR